MEEGLRRVLVVDQSKVVRSALAKHLRGQFDVREEADGESAWQSLVLDSSIVAIVSGAQLPRLSGYELLARLRISKLRRLCDIPFLLVVSGNESVEDRLRAHETGVTDFITRGMSREEILDCINRLINWEFAVNLTDSQIMPTAVPRNAPLAKPIAVPQAATLSIAELRKQLDSAIARQGATDGMVGVIAFGLDDAGSLAAQYGQKTLTTIAKRLGKILRAKIGETDSIGCDEHGRCIIVSPGSSLASCLAFAQRVCRGLAQSQVSLAGTPLNFKVSAGVAGIPADSAADGSAGDLLRLATDRLLHAQQAGGTRVVADDASAPGYGFSTDFFTEMMRFYCPVTANVQLGAIGLHLMPLFKAMDREFRFGLPLDEIERSFAMRAREEESSP